MVAHRAYVHYRWCIYDNMRLRTPRANKLCTCIFLKSFYASSSVTIIGGFTVFMNKKRLAMLVAELVGTFALAMVVLSINRYGLPIFTSLAAGVVIATMYAAVGGISGGHFNPAVTAGFLALRRISVLKALSYFAAQVVGAVLAWKLYEWFTDRTIALQTTEFDWQIFVAELVGTAIFGFAVAAVVYRKFDGQYAAATIGAGFFVGTTIASLVTLSGVLNPAVAIAVGYRPENAGYWAYLAGPVIGAVVGMLGYKFAFVDDEPKSTTAKAAVVTPVKKTATKKKAAPKKKTATKKK